jgi:hypothetical protein
VPDWLEAIRAELPVKIGDWTDLKARLGLTNCRLTWPADSLGLVLEVGLG